jgi:uncharacterized protein YbjT (DUF2867 family)
MTTLVIGATGKVGSRLTNLVIARRTWETRIDTPA